MACRITRKQEWTLRILLEANLHQFSVFITLTYDEYHIPDDEGLKKSDLTNFLKRFRDRIDYKIRYYACGEYGEKYDRPHYHIVMMGVDRQTVVEDVKEAWYPRGFVQVSWLTPGRAAYVAGYLEKKLTNVHDVPGKQPEYQVSSNRPGLGAKYADKILDSLEEADEIPVKIEGIEYIVDVDKIPSALRTQGKTLPLDRYMRERIVDSVIERYGARLPSQSLQAWRSQYVHTIELLKRAVKGYDSGRHLDKKYGQTKTRKKKEI